MEKTAAVILALMIGAPIFCGAEELKTLKLRSDFLCPYACEPGDHPGIIPEIVQNILGKKGYKIDYQLINWARAISDTREGLYDGLIGAAVSDAPDFIFPTEHQASAVYEFFTLKKNPWKYNGQLEGKKIAVINGYSYDSTISNFIRKKDSRFVVITGERAQEKMAKMLLANRVNVIYENPEAFRETLKKLKINKEDFQSAGAPQQIPQKLFVAFSPKKKNSKQLANEIDLGMKKFRKTEEFKKLLQKYGMKDVTKI